MYYLKKPINILIFISTIFPFASFAQQRGLQAEYFNDIELKDHVLSRIESKPYLNYNLESPAPGVNSEYFSVRWTGVIAPPESGLYKFLVRADDGIRLWVDNQKIIDSWHDQRATNFDGSIYLEKDKQYDMKLEYYNSIVLSVLTLSWETPEDGYSFMGYTFFKTDSEVPSSVFTVQPKRSVESTDTLSLGQLKTVAEVGPNVSRVKTKLKPKKPESKPGIGFDNLIDLKPVYFEQTNYDLLDEAYDELNVIIGYLKINPQLKIKIIGHTDYAGDSTSNYVLSKKRADVIADYFKANGISQQRIFVEALGGSRPLIVHDEILNRMDNRRVEFVIVNE
jgi:outer membrane protein OmpA-like peptidoglycan-associated protein